MRVLCFEGAGCPEADESKATIGNCRIRTAFHLDNGKAVFLEIIGSERPSKKKDLPDWFKWEHTSLVDSCFYITADLPNDDANLHRLLMHGGEEAEREAEAVFRENMRAGYKTPEEQEENYKKRCEICDNFVESNTHFEYSKSGILDFLGSIGATFDDIRVVNDGYRVFKELDLPSSRFGIWAYNFGDEYVIQFRR